MLYQCDDCRSTVPGEHRPDCVFSKPKRGTKRVPITGKGDFAPMSYDDIPHELIRIYDSTDLREYPINAELVRVALMRNEFVTERAQHAEWKSHWLQSPGEPPAEAAANQWVFCFRDGLWHGCAGHWMRPDQQAKGMFPYHNIGGNGAGDGMYFRPSNGPLYSWRPRIGEHFAVAVSSPARTGVRTEPNGRTPIRLVEYREESECPFVVRQDPVPNPDPQPNPNPDPQPQPEPPNGFQDLIDAINRNTQALARVAAQIEESESNIRADLAKGVRIRF